MEGIQTSNSFAIIDSSVYTQQESETEFSTPVQTHTMGSVQDSGSCINKSVDSNKSTEPRNFRLLSKVYNDKEEIELFDKLIFLGIEEPTSYTQAAREIEWQTTMQNEKDSIEENNTWVLTELSPGRKAISLKWVYKIKKDTNGEM